MIPRITLALLISLSAPAWGALVYSTTQTTDQFGTVDLSTGVFTSIGTMSTQLAGLGEVGGALYGGADGGEALYQINTANGSLSFIANNNSFSYVAFGSTLGTLYALDFSFNLYSVNPSTGATTLIGSTGLSPGGNYELSTNSNTLYFALSNNLYTINTTTGSATLVGSLGGSAQLGALLWDGVSTLYGVQTTPSQNVDTINTSTGAATAGAAVTGAGQFLIGFAPDTGATTPEPATWGLTALALAALTVIKRRA
jgi:hypothetical protein